MINNLELIKPLLNFKNEGDFYMIYILKRKKDQPIGEKQNHQSVRTIKSYCVESIEYLEERFDEMKHLCEAMKARCYIEIGNKNHFILTAEIITALGEKMKNGQFNHKYLFDSVVGKVKSKEKRFIVDIDEKDETITNEIINYINNNCRPIGKKILAKIPTKNGFHLITNRFDVKVFLEQFPNVEVKKNNPTLLYLPNSLK